MREVTFGRGRVVVYKGDSPDSDALAKDMLDLVGEENLGVRVFNVPSLLACASSDRSGKRLLLHFVNYATRPAESMTVRISGDFRTARLIGSSTGGLI